MALIILGAAMAITALLPRPKLPSQKPATLGDFNFPRVSEAQVITVMRGTVKNDALNYLEVGDYRVEPVYKKTANPATLGITKTKTKIGERYHCGAIMSFGLGSSSTTYKAKLKELFIDDLSVWTGSITSGTITVDKPELYGGDERRGGYVATLEYYPGEWPNGTSSYWKTTVLGGNDYVAYDGQILLIQRGPSSGRIGNAYSGFFSTSTSVPPMAAVFEICPGLIGDANKALVNDGDYNIANFLYEYVTNTEWGMGEPTSRVNLSAFEDAQETFYDEGMGVSVKIEGQRKIRDFVQDLERIADCHLFYNPELGLWDLVLIRDDYDPETIPVLDEENVLEYTAIQVNAPVEVTNKITVSYVDKATWKERTADFKETASRYNQGYQIANPINFWGVANADLASDLASREGRVLSLSLPRGTLRANRKAYAIKPGGVFWLKREGWPDRVMRCIAKNDGQLLNGEIEIEFVQDVFALSSAKYASPVASPSGSLSTGATDATDVVFDEKPYFLSGQAVKTFLVAKQPNGSQIDFDLYISEDAGTTYSIRDTRADFAPAAAVAAAYAWNTGPVDASSLVVNDLGGMGLVQSFSATDLTKGFNLFRWATGEYCACESVTDLGGGQFRLNNTWRGLLDTTPENHASGEKLYFVGYGVADPESVFSVGQTIRAKLSPMTINGSLPIASATAHLLTLVGRYGRPLPPANLTINGSATSTAIPAAGSDITLAWNHRDRTRQTTVLKQNDASVGPEIGATYTVKVYNSTGTLLGTYANLTGTSWIHTAALQTSDGSAAVTALIYQVYTVVDGVNSTYPQVRRVARPTGTVPTATPTHTLTGTVATPPPGDASSISGAPISNDPSSTNNTPIFNSDGTITWQPTPAAAGSMLFKGTWSSATAYVINDVVKYSGAFYIAKTDNTNKQPDINTSDWDVI